MLQRCLLLLVCLSLLGAGVSCGRKEAKPKINVQEQIKLLQSGDSKAKEEAAIALAEAGEKAEPAVPALIATLKDKDPLIRRLSAYALGEIGPKAASAVPALKEALPDPNRDVVFAVANALRSIDPKAAGELKLENVSGQ